MSIPTTPSVAGGAAVTAVSPMALGGETKNQDRAHWYPAVRVAAVADGVSASPRAADAAELAVQFSPALLHGQAPIDQRLRTLADLLITRRLEAQAAGVKAGSDLPAAIHAMLQDAAREKLATSYQTTLVAAGFVPAGQTIATTILHVGDAAFFAFDPQGQLLFTTLQPPRQADPAPAQDDDGVAFGPGAALLCRIVGDAAQYPELAADAHIRPGSAGNWLVVTPLDQLRPAGRPPRATSNGRTLIQRGEPILAPRYLIQLIEDGGCEGLCRLHYSRHIRIPGADRPPQPTLSGKGHRTAVLPDHIAAGHWTCVTESFGTDSQFLLCSDGFYSAFDDPHRMWLWLVDHETALRQPRQRERVLHQLHQQLQQTAGDDDISLIWIRGASLVARDAVQAEEADDDR